MVPEGYRVFCSIPNGSGGSQNGLDIAGHFWDCLDGSGGSGLSSEAGMCWLATPVGAKLA